MRLECGYDCDGLDCDRGAKNTLNWLVPVYNTLSRVWRFIRAHGTIAWLILLAILLSILLWRSQGEIADTWDALGNANPLWLVLGLALQIVILGFAVLVLWVLLARLGHRLDAWSVTRAQFQRVVAGNLAPVSGPASAAAYANYLYSRGVPVGDSILSLVLNGIASYGALVLFGLPALILLFLQFEVSGVALVVVPALIIGFAVMTYSLLFLFRDSGLPGWITRRLPQRVYEYVEEIRSHQIEARDLLRPILLSLPIKVLGATLLYVCLLAIGPDPPVSAALAGYAAATLFRSVVIPFGGLGIVELGTVIVLQKFGISLGDALAATLLYRFAEFWLPLAFGLLLQVVARR